MIKIAYPADWAPATPGSEILVTGASDIDNVQIQVFTLESVQNGDLHSVECITCSRQAEPGIMYGSLGQELADGNYVLHLLADGNTVDSRGVRIVPSLGAWADALLERAEAARHVVDNASATSSASPLFSITTTVYDTPVPFLKELAANIRAQSVTDFEWLILDNGSLREDVVKAVKAIASADPRFRYFRVSSNIHIIPGNRYLLERALGRYILPVDSDDILYPFALEVLADRLRVAEPPQVIFSDEAKLSPSGRPAEYIWRTEYSRIGSLSTCPVAHVLTFDRLAALENDVYGDSYAQGSHDWDTLMRLTDAGARVERVRDCLYGWRMHMASSSMNLGSKGYLQDSQFSVVEHSLKRRRLDRQFRIEYAIPGRQAYFAIRRLPINPCPVEIDLHLSDTGINSIANARRNLMLCRYPSITRLRVLYPGTTLPAKLGDILGIAAARAGLPVPTFVPYGDEGLPGLLSQRDEEARIKIIIGCDGVLGSSDDWIWELVGTFELDERVGFVGGAVLDPPGERIHHIGWVIGLDGFAGTPCPGNLLHDVPGGTISVCRRAVTAVWGGLIALRDTLVDMIGAPAGVDGFTGVHGLEYGLRCRRHGWIGAYHPALRTQIERAARVVELGSAAAAQMRADYEDLLVEDAYYHPALSMDSSQYDQFPTQEVLPTAKIVANSDDPEIAQFLAAAGPDYWLGKITDAPILRFMSPAKPLNLSLDPSLRDRPTLNVIIPGLAMECMSGGPNTALNLGYRLAMGGIPVRFIASDVAADADLGPLRRHIMKLAGASTWLPHVSIANAVDRNTALPIGSRDMFLATAWWTAQMIIQQLPRMAIKRFFYLIQDYEPILHPGSSLQAMALASYEADFIPIVNHPLLHEYFVANQVGRFADPKLQQEALVFTPAIDRELFWPEAARPPSKKTRQLLFYARPVTGIRNLFEIGTMALHIVAMRGLFDGEAWEIQAMGEAISPVRLSASLSLEPLPWLGLDNYARQMRHADMLLSLMMAPHPSYPPLEIAACGGIAVTNGFGTKTAEKMNALSRNIITAAPDVDSVVAAITEGLRRLRDPRWRPDGLAGHPSSWNETFQSLVPALIERWRGMVSSAV